MCDVRLDRSVIVLIFVRSSSRMVGLISCRWGGGSDQTPCKDQISCPTCRGRWWRGMEELNLGLVYLGSSRNPKLRFLDFSLQKERAAVVTKRFNFSREVATQLFVHG